MMCSFMAAGSGLLEVMPEVLASVFQVGVEETDVSAASEWDDRNWDATVTCEYESLSGDLDWAFSIFAADEVDRQPSERELALFLARQLGVAVFFEWGPDLPWVRNVAMPSGEVTRARLTEPDDDGSGYCVEVTESPVPGFPRVTVARLPEVVKALHIDTPITDSVAAVSDEAVGARAIQLLGNWERLMVRLCSDWASAGWYAADMYYDDLALRQEAEGLISTLSDSGRGLIEPRLQELDDAYRDFTVDDGGCALAVALNLPGGTLAERAWYWRRRPKRVPWK